VCVCVLVCVYVSFASSQPSLSSLSLSLSLSLSHTHTHTHIAELTITCFSLFLVGSTREACTHTKKTHTHTHTHTHFHLSIYLCVCVCVYIHGRAPYHLLQPLPRRINKRGMHTQRFTHAHTHTYTHIHVSMCVCVYTYIAELPITCFSLLRVGSTREACTGNMLKVHMKEMTKMGHASRASRQWAGQALCVRVCVCVGGVF
jgi:hypothetical protein